MTKKEKILAQTEVKDEKKIIYVIEKPDGTLDRTWFGHRPNAVRVLRQLGYKKWYRFVEYPRQPYPKSKVEKADESNGQ